MHDGFWLTYAPPGAWLDPKTFCTVGLTGLWNVCAGLHELTDDPTDVPPNKIGLAGDARGNEFRPTDVPDISPDLFP